MAGVKGQKHIHRRRSGIINHYTHGLSNTRLYRIWSNMKNRCNNPKSNRAYIYQRKGITVCDEWRNDFKAFYDWSMSHGYSDELTLDRINNDGNYEPNNCRWVDAHVQNTNKTCIPTYEFQGINFHQCDVENLFGIKRTTFVRRLESGMSIEQALLTPVRKVMRRMG